jgi:serine/threonine protein kinase
MDSLSNLSRADSFIAAGTVSVIYAVDENIVIKIRPSSGGFERQAYDIEIRSYERLGYHERIATCEVTEEGLLLERGTCLRGMLQSVSKSAIPWAMKLQWALEAADGLAYIHTKGIIHADVGCHNIIVDNASHVKFIDFAGSGIDGEAPLVCYEWCSFQPGNEIGICTDIFAFGSMLFELETERVPYNELERTLEMGKLVTVVERLFSQQKFPSVEALAFGSVISGCWNGKYTSMDEVHRDIARCCENYSEGRLNRATLGAD